MSGKHCVQMGKMGNRKKTKIKRDFFFYFKFELVPTDLWLLSMMVQTQVSGKILSGWDQAPSKVKPSLHGLSGHTGTVECVGSGKTLFSCH